MRGHSGQGMARFEKCLRIEMTHSDVVRILLPNLHNLRGLQVNQAQCCLRVAAGPYRPITPITQLSPYFMQNLGTSTMARRQQLSVENYSAFESFEDNAA